MTPNEAQDQISAAIESLKSIRDTLGAQLARPGVDRIAPNSETRRLLDLHDRVARAIQAYC